MILLHLLQTISTFSLNLQRADCDSHEQADDEYYLSSINSIRGIFFDRALNDRKSSQGDSNALNAGAIHVFNGSKVFRLTQYQLNDGNDDSIDLHAVDPAPKDWEKVVQSIKETIGHFNDVTFLMFEGKLSYVQHIAGRDDYIHKCALLKGEEWLVKPSGSHNNGRWKFVTHRIERTLDPPYSKIFSDNYGIPDNKSSEDEIYDRTTIDLTTGFPIAGNTISPEFIRSLDSRTPAFLIPISIKDLGGSYYLGLYTQSAQYSVNKWRGSGPNSYPGTKCDEALDAIRYRSQRPGISPHAELDIMILTLALVINAFLLVNPGKILPIGNSLYLMHQPCIQ